MGTRSQSPQIGESVNGWVVIDVVTRRRQRLLVTRCPSCGVTYERDLQICRDSPRCRACHNADRTRAPKRHTKGKGREVKITRCCTNWRCPVCAGTDRAVVLA